MDNISVQHFKVNSGVRSGPLTTLLYFPNLSHEKSVREAVIQCASICSDLYFIQIMLMLSAPNQQPSPTTNLYVGVVDSRVQHQCAELTTVHNVATWPPPTPTIQWLERYWQQRSSNPAQKARQGAAEYLVNDCERLAAVPEHIMTPPQRPLAAQQRLQLLAGAQVQRLDVAVQLDALLAQVHPDGLLRVLHVPERRHTRVAATPKQVKEDRCSCEHPQHAQGKPGQELPLVCGLHKRYYLDK